MAVQRDNPYLNFNFLVDIGFGENMGFSEVAIPSGEIEVIEYREGDDKLNTARKLPGLAKYPNVTLKRGITGRTDLFEWWKSVRDGQVVRRNVTITLLPEVFPGETDPPPPPVGIVVPATSRYTFRVNQVAGLRPAVDRFFTEVFVMADDARVRDARLTLMADLRDLILDLADISEIVPQTE